MSSGRQQLSRKIVTKTYLLSLGKKIPSQRLALFMSSTKAATLGKISSQRNFLKIVELIHKTGVDVFLKTYMMSSTKTCFMNQPSGPEIILCNRFGDICNCCS